MTFAAAWRAAQVTAGCSQTGDTVTARFTRPRRACQRGFTYLWLLFVLAAGAGGLASLGQRASIAVQRDREAELIFRGVEIARAISTYRAATPGLAKTLPASLQDLLDDRRGPRPVRHLRRVYVDPFTGKADWILITTSDGRISGVHSRATAFSLRVADLRPAATGQQRLVSDRMFIYSEAAEPSGSASAPLITTDPSRHDKAPNKAAEESQE